MTTAADGWLALALVDGVGAKTLARLVEACGSVEAVLATPAPELVRRCGLHPELAERIAAARSDKRLPKERARIAEQGVHLLPAADARYPARLRELPLPPALLYAAGDVPLPEGPALAVVGTRQPTRYGERTTRRLIEEAAAALPGLVVVSGMARGIDTVAHTHALHCGLKTVAVLGTGLGHVYPRENKRLAAQIRAQGTLLSEFAMAQGPLARNFPIRNRVISALADAVLVVEAGAESGALITAGFAQNLGRPVLALPGNVDQPQSAGTNRLIGSGQARLVTNGAALAATLHGARHPAPTQLDWLDPPAPPRRREAPARLAGEKGRIVACLERGPLHPDDLAAEVALPIERLSGLLLELELSGEIYQTADNHYALA